MNIFTYDLPPARIAQRPVHPYDSARLLVAQRHKRSLHESHFSSLTDSLRPGDVLVFNDTRVIPARLFGRLPGGGEVEVLLHRKLASDSWRCLGKPLKKLKPGTVIQFANGLLALAGSRLDQYEIELSFSSTHPDKTAAELLASQGIMPIPPYIRGGKADDLDIADYQTFFAAREGSVAAPTASLHFTPELMDRIRALGCEVRFLTLHVGSASFLALSENGEGGLVPPGSERFRPDMELVQKALAVRAAGGRVIPVGTTAVRALESMAGAAADTEFAETELFITPGYPFKLVDAMFTNFHQSGTTHLLLVEAFLGREMLARAYEHALASDFRFLSYGDGMFLC